jgi:hypothetical protein
MPSAFYSDRIGQSSPRVNEDISATAWQGLTALIRGRLSDGSLARDFTRRDCRDGDYVTGTDEELFSDSLFAHIPALAEEGLDPNVPPPTPVALDVIDFVARHIADPTSRSYHSFLGHEHLFFRDPDPAVLLGTALTPGQERFRADVDMILSRNGIAFTLGNDMRVGRMGPPEARALISDFRPATGDPALDDLFSEAMTRFTSRDTGDRQVALEKLWDALERLKTLRRRGDKKASLEELLLSALPDAEEFRGQVNAEFRVLTEIGNHFRIRHHEHDRHALPDAAAEDYLFVRLAALIAYILRRTGLMAQ